MSKRKYFLYRVAVVRYVDSLFYEPGNFRRCHIRTHARLVGRLCGIGQDTFRRYLHYPDEALDDYELSADLQNMLRLYVTLHKTMPAQQVSQFLQMLTRHSLRAVQEAQEHADTLTAEQLFALLFKESPQ